jgi:hypothetical protein
MTFPEKPSVLLHFFNIQQMDDDTGASLSIIKFLNAYNVHVAWQLILSGA